MIALKKLLKNSLYRFFSIGAINTGFSYFSTIIIFQIFSNFYSTFYLAIVSSLVSMFFSFNTNYFFVFKPDNYLQSMIRALSVYGLFALFSILLLVVLVDYAGFNIWISKFLNLCISIPLMYLVHRRFTYK
jgi:putative flippase GtrA